MMIGDGQMSIGNVVAKPNARKLRKLHKDQVVCGFAGGAADGIALVDLLEKKLSERSGLSFHTTTDVYSVNVRKTSELKRAAVEVAKMWRTDKIYRHLNALLLVADKRMTLELTGSGELVEADEPVIAIGSGGNYAIGTLLSFVNDLFSFMLLFV